MKTIQDQKKLALRLLDFHGGQSSGLYAVGSCMLADSDRKHAYKPENHKFHETAIRMAIPELRDLRKGANYPECVSAKDEKDANKLADVLEMSYL